MKITFTEVSLLFIVDYLIMKKKLLLLIMLLIFIVSTVTFFLILNYFDPYSAPILGIILLTTIFILSLLSFTTLFLYLIKKIHYRWNINIFHVKTSFRQAVFFSLFILWIIVFKIYSVPVFISFLLLWVLFCSLELFIRNLK